MTDDSLPDTVKDDLREYKNRYGLEALLPLLGMVPVVISFDEPITGVPAWHLWRESEQAVLDPEDLRIDEFRQALFTSKFTYAAVRITHLPTGLVSECGEFPSLIRNKAAALRSLSQRVQESGWKP